MGCDILHVSSVQLSTRVTARGTASWFDFRFVGARLFAFFVCFTIIFIVKVPVTVSTGETIALVYELRVVVLTYSVTIESVSL